MNTNAEKHAYLIMAHHRPDLLKELLRALDDPRNDIYLHIDSSAGPDMDASQFGMKKSRLTVLPRGRVSWGGYSQIRCELELLEAALRGGEYSRFHLMTGATFPTADQDEIHSFFDRHPGTEFIAYDDPLRSYDRVAHIHLFSEYGKGLTGIRQRMRKRFYDLQSRLNYDRFKHFHMEYKKGLAYWSLTNGAAQYLVSRKKLIKRIFKYSICGDECFSQTMLWNSPFRDRLTAEGTDGPDSLRITTWPLEDSGFTRAGHCFTADDLDFILDSKAFFALKFEGPDGMWLIDQIKNRRSIS